MKRKYRKSMLERILDTIWIIICIPFKIISAIVNALSNKPKTRYKEKEELVYASTYEDVYGKSIEVPKEYKYKRKYLLTKNEWDFYHQLKPVADKYGYVVLTKIRMADLVDPVAQNKTDYNAAFSKIKAKHVDFAFARPENLYVELLIELDDSSHLEGNERDAFVERVYEDVGYKLLRIRNGQNVEQMVAQGLGITPAQNT